ncbi:hypothetical protein C0J50_0190, partial [Silurus asotus]
AKTELLVIQGNISPGQDLQITHHNSLLSPLATARNLGLTIDNQLSFSSHVAEVWLVLVDFFSTTSEGFNHFCPHYCNSLLAGLPLNAICPLQMIQNATARLVQPAYVFPCHPTAHMLHMPSYLRDLITPHTTPCCLRSSSTARLLPPSLRMRGKYTSRLFSVLAPKWWNELPLDVRTTESLAIFKRRINT